MIANADAVQELNGAPFPPAHALPPAAFIGPGRNVLHQLFTNALRRIETGLRLLKNHRYVMTEDFPPLARREAHQIDVVKAHSVCGDPPVIFGHAADRFGYQAFARAGFAHQTADFAFGKGQRDAIDGPDPAFAGLDLNGQITNIK